MSNPSKKAQISIQFNWVFAIIIGAVILSFFVVVIQKQKKSSDLDLANDLLSDMDLILAGQTVSVGREDLMEIPKREIKFDCEEYSIMDMTRQKGNAIIFSPKLFESDRMLAWTLSWDLPFKIANFVYLTTPDIKYYLVYQNANDIGPMSVGEYIINNFPENLELREFGNLVVIPDDDNQIRMIYLGVTPASVPPKLIGARNQDVTALHIDVDPMDIDSFDRAKLEFFVKDGGLFKRQTNSEFSSGVYPAFGKESIFGAMFTNDLELYDCTMKKALKRMAIVAEVYNKRSKAMHDDPLTQQSCKQYYGEIFDAFMYKEGDDLEGFQGDVFGAEEYAWDTNRKIILASCSTLY